ncbi:T9SS type A sorting domain-containing protein [Cytophagaceae bacterium DM2B3-1]|uniref:T9SS type A sorting domain-containing protein n=1 Tax=Xanthocytophaga flava TaxID=3048013 RepID=A0ABT7D1A7_9BACT|nr:T9SS type A sorting domain-containing protein [Xanthocytophaga flavus]MDJ1498952.1 T9SS type A sorting domain-containing protein [Xanthocytophaga flavus]
MKAFLIIFFSLALTCSLPLYAQKEALHWYFGPKLGFDFTGGSAQIVRNSAMNSSRGCATISDKNTGELLFYSNGHNIWNRFHHRMPTSTSFPEDCSNFIVQSVLIVPVPEDIDKYYLFSLYVLVGERLDTTFNCSSGDISETVLGNKTYYYQLRYSIIDMRLDDGRGDIVPDKNNIFLQNNLSTKLTAIPHTNGKDYWLITHQDIGNSFYVHLLNQAGIQNPIQQNIGSVYQIRQVDNMIYYEILGELKASPNGKKLACAVYNGLERPFDVFDFDASTGTISNYQNYGNISQQMGVSFSPDNSKLYVTSSNKIDETNLRELIRQYDMTLSTPEQIVASGKSIIRFNPYTNISEKAWPVNVVFNTLHIAPDGKIYGAGEGSGTNSTNNALLVIGKPNSPGFDCGVTMKRFNFNLSDEGVGFRSLPNFIQSYFNNIPTIPDPDCNESDVTLFPNPVQQELTLTPLCGYVPTYVEIIDHLGRIVSTQHLDTTQIQLNALASGMYVLRIFNADQKTVIKKIIKL